MDQCTGEGQLLLHPSRELSRKPILEWFYLNVNVLDQMVIFLDGSSKNRGKKLQVLLNGEVLVQRKPSWHIANHGTDLAKIGNNIQSIEGGKTVIR